MNHRWYVVTVGNSHTVTTSRARAYARWKQLEQIARSNNYAIPVTLVGPEGPIAAWRKRVEYYRGEIVAFWDTYEEEE